MTEYVYVVMESQDVIPTERIRRVFDNEDAADDYVNDPENVGRFHVECEELLSEWVGFA